MSNIDVDVDVEAKESSKLESIGLSADEERWLRELPNRSRSQENNQESLEPAVCDVCKFHRKSFREESKEVPEYSVAQGAAPP